MTVNPNQLLVTLYGPESTVSCHRCDSNDTVGLVQRAGRKSDEYCMDCFFDLAADRINLPVTFEGHDADEVSREFIDIRLQYECDACSL